MILMLVLLASGIQFLTNCAKPLDSSDIYDPDPQVIVISDTVFTNDTVFVYDTLFGGDTIIVVDTLIGGDTIFVVDTIFGGDTIIVIDTIYGTGDTIYLIDTIFSGDTIFVIDTTTLIDTVIYTDTLLLLDTVFVPDSGATPFVCSQMGSNQQEIFWMFRNDEGNYLLEFVGSSDRDKPANTIKLEIGDDLYEWALGENPELTITRPMQENAVIRIYSDQPHSFGHPINICLTMTKE